MAHIYNWINIFSFARGYVGFSPSFYVSSSASKSTGHTTQFLVIFSLYLNSDILKSSENSVNKIHHFMDYKYIHYINYIKRFGVHRTYINICRTRCNTKQSINYSASSLYMFRVSTTPIIRSTQNCNYRLRY